MTERWSIDLLLDEKAKENIRENISIIKENMKKASEKAGRDNEAVLLLATKTQSCEAINYAISCGVTHIGENRVQELCDKYDGINKENVSIHFIGHLQTNKVKYIIDKVDMIQSVDRLSLAREIDRQAAKAGKVMPVLMEINVGQEESKSGVLPEQAIKLAGELALLKNISLEGVMTIPPASADENTLRQFFKKIIDIFIDISRKKLHNSNVHIVSMGMSSDYEIAIQEKSTMIRVGSAVFGARPAVLKK